MANKSEYSADNWNQFQNIPNGILCHRASDMICHIYFLKRI